MTTDSTKSNLPKKIFFFFNIQDFYKVITDPMLSGLFYKQLCDSLIWSVIVNFLNLEAHRSPISGSLVELVGGGSLINRAYHA